MGMKGNTFKLGRKSGERDVKYIRVMLGDAATQASVPYSPPAGSCWLYCVDSHNTYGGTGACTNLTTPGGDDNTVLGYGAMYYNETGDQNVVIGSDAARGATGNSTSQSVIIGYQAGYTGTTSMQENTFIGYSAGHLNTNGDNNVFVGSSSGVSNTSGASNVFVGLTSGSDNTIGSENVAIGFDALNNNQEGSYNTFLGTYAGWGASGQSHDGNTGIGYDALSVISTGDYNVALGYQAGSSVATGEKNVFLGHQAGKNETGSNKLYIENSDAASTAALIYGEFDNDILVFNATVTSGAMEIGVAAGDPVIIFDIGGTDKFTIGVDDSDGDKFKISDGGALGASDRYTLDSAGVHTFGDGGVTDYLEIEADGTLEFVGAATVWDDLRVSVNSVRVPASKNPTWTAYSASQLLGFSYQAAGGNEEEVYFTAQIPHGYKQGSDITPHVHWIANEDTTDDPEVVRWGLEYEWVNIGSDFSGTTTIYAEESMTDEADKHQLTNFSAIAGAGRTISSMIVCRLFRNSSSVNDTYDNGTALALLLEFDFHFELDGVGSRLIASK